METKEIKVIAPKGVYEYLTEGKTYIGKIINENIGNIYFSIKDDGGDLIYCVANGCSHLKFKNWIIKTI